MCRAAAVAAILIVAATAAAQPVETHGTAVGDPLPHLATVWVRASDAALVSIIWGVAGATGPASETTPVLAGPATDFTAKIDLQGLLPSTTYAYRTRLADPAVPASFSLGPPGTFRTAPLPNATADLVMLFGADIATTGDFAIFDAMSGIGADLALLLGDCPYADGATTLAEYRAKHQLVRAEPQLQGFLRGTAIVPIWDDHEIVNDWDAATNPTLVANGRAVWKEYFPVRPAGDDTWRSLRFGTAAEFFILDTRTHRSADAAPDLPGKTLLGAAQRSWLLGALAASTATFKFVVSSVPLRFGTTNKDHWQGAMHERRQILDWVAVQRIPGVIVLSGDQHWSAVHHHAEGVKEFQACPLTASVRTPPAFPEPEVVAIDAVPSFGVLRVHALASPPRVDIEIRSAAGLIRTATVEAGLPGALRFTSDDPDAAVVLDGPHRFSDRGEDLRWPYAPPGTYAVTVTPSDPAATPLPIPPIPCPPGGFASLATDTGAAGPPPGPVLFRDHFDDGDIAGWTVVDEGTTDTPSAWFVDDRTLVQSSNIYGGSTTAASPDKPGTFVAAGDPGLTDFVLSFRVKTHDDDVVGAMIRLGPDGSHYGFAMDRQRNYQRIFRRLGGTTTTLAEAAAGYEMDRWYDVAFRCSGPSLAVFLDGIQILSATDTAMAAGRFALYSWGSQVVWFDDVVVRPDFPPAAPGAIFHDGFDDGVLAGWTVVDQGSQSAPSAWSETGGAALQSSNIWGGSLSGTDPDKPGTFLLAGGVVMTDGTLRCRVRNADNDAMGLMFRATASGDGYRFSMDSERGYRRLTRTLGGTTTILAGDSVPFMPGRWYDIAITASGPAISVRIDGALILAATDSAFASGGVALYCWGSAGVEFDHVTIAPPSAGGSALWASGSTGGFSLGVLAPDRPARAFVLAFALSPNPGIPLAILDPADPRVLPLAPDPLFFLSLSPSPFFSGLSGILDAAGRAGATAALPASPALAGFSLTASGLVLEAGMPSGVALVLPALPIVLP